MKKRGKPLFFVSHTGVITEEQVRSILEEKAEEFGHFLVTVRVNAGNQIQVEMDNKDGFGIDDCKIMSRHLESTLDREIEDFSLELSTPGVGKPLKVHQQYLKNIGRTVEVAFDEAKKIKGTLTAADENQIEVMTREKVRIEGRKAKKWVETQHKLPFDQIKETIVVVEFK